MGSHTSSKININENNQKKNIKIIQIDLPIEVNDIAKSNYTDNDVQMKEGSENTKSVSGQSTSKETLERGLEIQDNCVPTLFEWNEEGDSIFITGSFSCWAQKIPMKEIAQGKFKLILNLPRGIYQYKFIVDNQWRYNPQLPIFKDETGNINNYIDNSNYFKENSKGDSDSLKQSHHHTKKQTLMNFFSNIFPSKTQLNTDSPVVPSQYGRLLNLNYNTNQPLIGEKTFIPKKFDLHTENNAATSITFPSHVIL